MTYKLQNDVNMALSSEEPLFNSAHASQAPGTNGFQGGVLQAGARPKNSAAVNLSRGHRPCPSPPTYQHVLPGQQPSGNPIRNENLWQPQRKGLTEDEVEFSV